MKTRAESTPRVATLLPAGLLIFGLTGYGFSMAMMVQAGLGLDPWDVFHQGLSRHTGMTIGLASAVVGVVVLLAWIPLRNRPGIGTIANVIVIAVTVDIGIAVLPAPDGIGLRVPMMLGAVLLNAVSTVLYIGAGLGPGPRDGLMTGLVARTGLSVRLVRTLIEATVLTAGWLLGGTVGVGTVIYAFGIGPLVQLILRYMPRRLLFHDFGAAGRAERREMAAGRAERREMAAGRAERREMAPGRAERREMAAGRAERREMAPGGGGRRRLAEGDDTTMSGCQQTSPSQTPTC